MCDHNNSGWKGPPASFRPTSLSKLGQLWDQTRDLATWALKTSEGRNVEPLYPKCVFITHVVQVVPQNSSYARAEYPTGFKSATLPTDLS